ncbi:MAG: PepSY-associated TM helix domain-containing protein [Actinomycetota bacterium]
MLKEDTALAPAPAPPDEMAEQDLTEPQSAGKSSPAMSGLYRAAWRWHFYSGMFVIPILLLLAVTGMIYLFKPQVEPIIYQDKMRVPLAAQGAVAVPLEQQLAAVVDAYPGYQVVQLKTPTYPGRSTQFSINNLARGEEGLDQWTGVHKWVFVNPNTGALLGDLDPKNTFMANVRELHGNLMVGGQEGVGDTVVEIVSSWSVILVASGFYLWWRGRKPRKAQKAAGPLTGRSLMRSRHALIGSLAGGFLVFFIVSGLPWSNFWGSKVSEIQAATATGRPQFGEDATTSSLKLGDLAGGELDLPWATQQFAVPTSDPEGAGHHPSGSLQPDGAAGAPQRIGLDRVAEIAEEGGPAPYGFSIGLPEGETGIYTVNFTQPNNPHGNRTLNIDQYSGRVLAGYGFGDYGILGKAVSDGIALHEGRRFGAGNLWFNFAICGLVIFLCITGPMMWWKRRPKGAWVAAPRRSSDPRTRRRLFWVVMVPIGILFPLGGITMLAVLVADWLILRRIPRLARAFGSA